MKAHKFSRTAAEKIAAAGGKTEVLVMFQTLGNIWKVEDLRKRIIFTLLMLVVFRIGSFIPVPNTNPEALKQIAAGGVFDLLNTFSGGAFLNFSIFAMGIMPYITASIIVQLLTMDVIPKFAQWAKEGEVGRRKLARLPDMVRLF